MRVLLLLIAANFLSSVGCSAYIAASGKKLDPLTSRELVHAEFGEPVATGTVDGKTYEEFQTRRKISEMWKGEYLLMPDVATLGLAEIYFFPRELFTATRRSVVGQRLRFIYDGSGNVWRINLDGGYTFFHSVSESGSTLSESKAETSGPHISSFESGGITIPLVP